MERKNKYKGFTLLEAMIVVVLIAILASIAYPSFQSTLAHNRASAAENEFSKALAYTRAEAISRNKRISLCPIGSGQRCGNDWSQGFFVFDDSNGDKIINNTKDILQTYYLKQPINIKSSNTSLTLLTWLPGGIRLEANSGIISTTFTFNPSKDGNQMQAQNKQCVLAQSGRLLCS